MNTRANFTRMQDSTQADWQVIGGEFMQFSTIYKSALDNKEPA
jgi:hypothetical protein